MADRPVQEKTDIRAAAFITLVVVAAIGIGVGVIGARVRLLQELHQWQRRNPAPRPPAAEQLPAQPRLEPLEPHSAKSSTAFISQQHEQEAALRSYGRTSDEKFVRVPIDKAIERVAKDLQSSQQPEAAGAKSRGLLTGGEANSGRVFSEGSP